MANNVDSGAPDAPPPLDPGVLGLIRASAPGLAEREDSFAGQLQSGIAALIPDLAADGRVLSERLVRSLLWVATAAQSPEAAADTLRWVGAQNRLEGFPEARYVDVTRALVLAVRSVSGDGWDNSMGSAWISYFRWAQPYLLAGAAQAAAERAAAERAEAERATAERAEAEQAAAEQAAAEQAAAERAEAERATAERATAERAEAERATAERAEAAQAAARLTAAGEP